MADFKQLIEIVLKFEEQNPEVFKNLANNVEANKSKILELAATYGKANAEAENSLKKVEESERKVNEVIAQGAAILANKSAQQSTTIGQLIDLTKKQEAAQNELTIAEQKYNSELAKQIDAHTKYKEEYAKVIQASKFHGEEQLALINKINNLTDESGTKQINVGNTVNAAVEKYTQALENRAFAEERYIGLLQKKLEIEAEIAKKESIASTSSTIGADPALAQGAIDNINALKAQSQELNSKILEAENSLKALGKEAQSATVLVQGALSFTPQNSKLSDALENDRKKFEQIAGESTKTASILETNQTKIAEASSKINALLNQRIELEKVIASNLEQQQNAERALAELRDKTDTKSVELSRQLIQFLEQFPKLNETNAKELDGINAALIRISDTRKNLIAGSNSQIFSEFEANYNASLTRLIERTGLTTKEISKLWSTVYAQLSADASKVSTEGAIAGVRPETLRILDQIKAKNAEVAAEKKKFDDQATSSVDKVNKELDLYLEKLDKVKQALLGNLQAAEGQAVGKREEQIQKEIKAETDRIKKIYERDVAEVKAGETAESVAKKKALAESALAKAEADRLVILTRLQAIKDAPEGRNNVERGAQEAARKSVEEEARANEQRIASAQQTLAKLNAIDQSELTSKAERNAKLLELENNYKTAIANALESGSAAKTEIVKKYEEQRQKIEEQYNNLRIQAVSERNQVEKAAKAEEAKLEAQFPQVFERAAKEIVRITTERNTKIKELDQRLQKERLDAANQDGSKLAEIERKYADERLKIEEDLKKQKSAILEQRNRDVIQGQQSPGQQLKVEFKTAFDAIAKDASALKTSLGTLFSSLGNINSPLTVIQENFDRVINNIARAGQTLGTTQSSLRETANQALKSASSFEEFGKALGKTGEALSGFLVGETSITALIGSLGQLIKAVPLVGQVMVAVGASVTLLVNQFQDLAKAAGEAAVKQTILTSSTGAGKEAIGGLALQYEKLGGTSLQALIAVDRLAETLGEAAKGSAKATEALAFFGVNAVDQATGKVTSADKALAQFLQNFRNIEDQTLRTSLGIELFGVRSFKLISTIAQNGQTMEDFIKIAERAGRVLSDQDEKILLKYRQSVAAISDTYGGLQVKLGTQLAPVLTELNQAWLEFVDNLDLDNSDLIESIKVLSQELVNFLKGIYQVGEVAIPILSAGLIGISNILLVFTNSIKLLINGLSLVIEPFAKLGIALGLVRENSIAVSKQFSTTKQSFAELGADTISLGSALGELITVFTELIDIITLPLQGIPQLGALINALSEDYLGISLSQKFFTDVNEKNNSSIAEAAKKYNDLGEAVVSAQTKLELISDTVKKELEEITRATDEQNLAVDIAYRNGLITQQDVAIKKSKIEEDLLKKKKELLEQELQAADDARKTEINKSSEIIRLKGNLEKEITRLRKIARDQEGTDEAKAAEKRIKLAEDTLKRLIKDEDELATAAGESGKKYTEVKKKLAQSDLEFAKNALAQRVAAEQKAAYDSEQAWKRYYDAQKAQRDIESIKIGESEKDGVLKKEEAVKQRIALEQEASDKELAELEGRVAGAKANAAVLEQIAAEQQKQEERAAEARREREKLGDVRTGVSSPQALDKAEKLDKEIKQAEELAEAYKKLGESGKDGTKQLVTGLEAIQKRSKDLEGDFRKAGESAGESFKGGFTKADGTFVPVKKEIEKSAAELGQNLKGVGKLVVETSEGTQNAVIANNKTAAATTTQISVQAVNTVVDAQQKGSTASIKYANDYYRGVVKGSTDSTETVKQNEEKLAELRQRKAVEDKRREAELRRAKIEGAFEELNTRIQVQQKERAEFEAYYAQKAAQSGNEIQLIRERTQFEIRSVNETISIKRQELELRRQLSGGRETQETIKLTQELKNLEADRFRINQTGYAQLANAIKSQNDALISYRQAEFELQQVENAGRLSGAELSQRESQFKISALQQQISFLQDEIALKQASGASTAELIQLETQLLNVRKQLIGAQNAQRAAQQQTAASTQALYSDLANLPAQASEYAKNITIENAREASAEIQKLLQRNGTFYLAQIAGLQEYATQQAYKAIEAIQKGIAQARAEANAKAADEARQRTQERAQQLLDIAREEARARAEAYKDFVEALKEIDNEESAELKQHAANIAKIERDKVKALAELEEEFRREDIKKARDHYYELQQEAINNRQKILDIESNAANNRFNFLRETILKEGNLRKEQAQLQKDLNQAQIDLRKAREAADADKTNVDLANAANEAQQRVNDITQQLGLVAQQQDTLSQKRKLEEGRTGELRKLTDQFKKGEISKEEYDELIKQTNEKFDLEKQYLDDRLEAIQNGDAQALAELDKAYAEQRQSLEDSNKEKLELIKIQNELEAQQRAEKDAEERDERERRRQEIIANAAQQLEDERIAHAERMGELKQQQAEIKAEYENNLAEIVQNSRDQLAEMGVAYDSFFQQLVQGYADIQNAADEALLSTTDFINGADAAASQSIIGKLRDKLAQYGVSQEILDKITPEGLGTGSGKDEGGSSGGGGNSTRGGSSSGSGGRNSTSSSGGGSGSGGNSTRGGNSTGGSTGGGGSSDPNAPEFTVTQQGGGSSSSAADREKNRAKAAERSIKLITNAVKVGNYTFQVGKDKLIELLSQGKINRSEFDAALGEIEDLTRESGTDGQGGGGNPGTGSNTETDTGAGTTGAGTSPAGGGSSTPTVYVPSSASGDISAIRADVAAIRGALGAGGTTGGASGTTGGVTTQNTRASSGTGAGTAQEQSDGRIQVGPSGNLDDFKPAGGATVTPTADKTKTAGGARPNDDGTVTTYDSEGNEISNEEYKTLLAQGAVKKSGGSINDYIQAKLKDIFYESQLDDYAAIIEKALKSGKISKDDYDKAIVTINKRREEIQQANENVTGEEVARGRQDSIDVSQRTIDFGKDQVKGGENKKAKYDKIIADVKSGKLDKESAGKALSELGISNEYIWQVLQAAETQQLAESGAFDDSIKQGAGASKLYIQEKSAALGLSEQDVAKKQEEVKLQKLELSSTSLSQSGLKKEDEIKIVNDILEKVKSGGLSSTQANSEIDALYKDGKISQSVDIQKIKQAIFYAEDAYRATQYEGALQVLYDEARAQGKEDVLSLSTNDQSGGSFEDVLNYGTGGDTTTGGGGKFGTTEDAGATPGEPPPAPAPTDDDYINKVFDKFLSGEYDKSLAASALTAGANEGKIKDLKKYSAAIAKLEELHRDKLSGAGTAAVSAADTAQGTADALDSSAGLTQVEPPKPPIINAGPPPTGSSGAQAISPVAENLAARIKNREFASMDEAIAEYDAALKAGDLSNPAAKALVDKELERWMAEEAKAKSSGLPAGLKSALDQSVAAKSPSAGADPNNARSQALKSKLLPGEKLNVAALGKSALDLKAAGDSKLGGAPKLGPATPLSATAVVSGLPNDMAQQVAQAMQKAGQQAAQAALNKVVDQISNTAGAEVNA